MSNYSQIQNLSILSFDQILYNELKLITLFKKHKDQIKFNQHEEKFIHLFLRNFSITSIDDFHNPEHQWRLDLFKHSPTTIFQSLSVIHLSLPSYYNSRFSEACKIFRNILSFQSTFLNILNLRLSFSFSSTALAESYDTSLLTPANLISTPLFKSKESFIKKIFNKFFSHEVDHNSLLLEKLHSFQKLNDILKEYHKKSEKESKYQSILKLIPEKKYLKLIEDSYIYIQEYNKFFMNNFYLSFDKDFKNWLKNFDTQKPYTEGLFFETLSYLINTNNFNNFDVLLNDYILSQFSNDSQKQIFFTDFFSEIYYRHKNLDPNYKKHTFFKESKTPYKIMLEELKNENIKESPDEQFNLIKTFLEKKINQWVDIQYLHNTLERVNNLTYAIELDSNKKTNTTNTHQRKKKI